MAITDAFTDTNGTGITAHNAAWAYVYGSGTDLQIQSNRLRVSGDGVDGIAQRTDGTFPADQYAQIVLSQLAAGQLIGIALGCQGAGSGDCVIAAADLDDVVLVQVTNGVFDWGGANTVASTVSNGGTLRLTRVGNTYTVTYNGSTDNMPSPMVTASFSGGSPGVYAMNDSGNGTTAALDDFECSDLAGGAVLRKNSLLRMFAGR